MSSEDQCLRRTRYSDHPDIPEKCPFTHGATGKRKLTGFLTFPVNATVVCCYVVKNRFKISTFLIRISKLNVTKLS